MGTEAVSEVGDRTRHFAADETALGQAAQQAGGVHPERKRAAKAEHYERVGQDRAVVIGDALTNSIIGPGTGGFERLRPGVGAGLNLSGDHARTEVRAGLDHEEGRVWHGGWWGNAVKQVGYKREQPLTVFGKAGLAFLVAVARGGDVAQIENGFELRLDFAADCQDSHTALVLGERVQGGTEEWQIVGPKV